MNNSKTIFQFNEVSDKFLNNLGEKAVNIGQLFHLSIPTAPGFIVSADSMRFFLDMSNLNELIKSKFYNLDSHNEEELKKLSEEIEDLIMKTPLPPFIEKEILRTYSKLSGFSDAYVSVRSSYIYGNSAEVDGTNQTSFLNIKGYAELILAIKACWASLYETENIQYRINNNIQPYDCASAIIIQKMLQTDISGITFSVSPVTKDIKEISIQAVLGIVDIIKNGEIKPDLYYIDKDALKFKEKSIARQDYMLVRNIKGKSIKDSIVKTKVAQKWQENQKIDDRVAITLARYAKILEEEYKKALEIEWVIEKGKIYILNVSPVLELKELNTKIEETHIEEEFEKEDKIIKENPQPLEEEIKDEIIQEIKEEKVEKEEEKEEPKEEILPTQPTTVFVEPKIEEIKNVETTEIKPKEEVKEDHKIKENKHQSSSANLLITGIPAYPGIIEGEIKVLKNINDADPNFNYDIIVLESISEDWRDILSHSKGIILDTGDMNSYETEIARELSLPCIIGTQVGTQVIQDNKYGILDGSTGRLYEIDRPQTNTEEEIKNEPQEEKKEEENTEEEVQKIKEKMVEDVKREIITATKVYTKIVDINLYKEVSKSGVDGIYISAEDLILDLKVHPKQIFSQQKNAEYIDDIAKKISNLCKEVGNDKNVIYTISNLTSNKLFELDGGVQFEVKEENPMLGYRGTLRNIKEIEILNMELEIVKSVRNKYGYKNLWIMIPYIRTIEELADMKKIIISQNLRRSSTFKIFIDIEVPSNVIMIDELLDIGVDGINIDYDNLAQMILGIDFSNPKLTKDIINYHPTMLKAISNIMDAVAKYKITSSITFDSINKDDEFLRYIIRRGINIINTNTENVYSLKENIQNIENEILTK